MKVLSIGNSFSQDSHKWLQKLAEKNGYDMQTANLYIGGCTLEMHWNNVIEDKADYSLELNGNRGERNISIDEALSMEEWDVVTLQQASPLSGIPQSYLPYLPDLVSLVREKQPKAKTYFIQTWSYETDAELKAFSNYNRDQNEMYRRLSDASEMASKLIEADIIPVGTVIQALRETVPEFDYQNGGLSLNRDGFHLTLDYGRFAAAATWFCSLTGEHINITDFEDFDVSLLNKIINVVDKTVFETHSAE